MKTDLKPPCVELQHNLGLRQKPQSPVNCHRLQLYNPEEKSHQKLFDRPQNHCLTMTYITLLSTKPGLQCLNHTGQNSKNGGTRGQNIFRKKKWENIRKFACFFSHCTLACSLCPLWQSSWKAWNCSFGPVELLLYFLHSKPSSIWILQEKNKPTNCDSV